jgi:hypothetical protein
MYTCEYNEKLNEWSIFRDNEIFCHLYDTDFWIFVSKWPCEIKQIK